MYTGIKDRSLKKHLILPQNSVKPGMVDNHYNHSIHIHVLSL